MALVSGEKSADLMDVISGLKESQSRKREKSRIPCFSVFVLSLFCVFVISFPFAAQLSLALGNGGRRTGGALLTPSRSFLRARDKMGPMVLTGIFSLVLISS
jgi:hypothetical protein